MNHLVGHTQDGVAVWVDLINTNASASIARQPHLLTMAADALKQTSVDDAQLALEYDMGRVIGYDFVVATPVGADVFYARLVRDKVYTRFVKKGRPASTRTLSFVLQKQTDEESYTIEDMWVGRQRPPRPSCAEASRDSVDYWCQHAVLYENQALHPRTITKDDPYSK